MASFGSVKDKGVIDLIARALNKRNAHKPGWQDLNSATIKAEFAADQEKTKKKYPDLFYFFDGLNGCKTSQSVHPAGMVISPIALADNYGVFEKDGDLCLFGDMDAMHDVGCAKFDFLILRNVDIIADTCEAAGIPYPKSHEVNWDDPFVWDDMMRCSIGIFQMEESYAFDCLKKFGAETIFDLSLVTACIRPSGASYRDNLLARKPHKNPSALIDDLLKDNNGYLVYQEDIIKFLQQICGLSGSQADSIRRGIAKKSMDILEKYMPLILDGYCSKSDKPREVAESEAREYLRIIEDASDYMFGYNHSVSYCLISYLCAYLRYYHPYEFITAYLNTAANDDDITNGEKLAHVYGIRVIAPRWGVSRSGYYFNKEQKIIAKGIGSIKHIGDAVAEKIYQVSQTVQSNRFMDVLPALHREAGANSQQLDMLTYIDYFQSFGNQRELLRIREMYEYFKRGEMKTIKKDKIAGSWLEPIVTAHSTGLTKAGKEAANWTIGDINAILHEVEDSIRNVHMDDLDDMTKVKNYEEATGYPGYVSGKEEDRRKLYIVDCKPVKRKADGQQFGVNIIGKSIGSGKETKYTIFNRLYERHPVKKGDIIYCEHFNTTTKMGVKYFTIDQYSKLF